MRSLKTLQELIYENGGLTGGQTNSSFIYDYMVKYLGDTVSYYEKERVRHEDIIAIKNNTIEKWMQDHEFEKNTIKAQAEEIEKYMKESATFQARKDTLEEWLTEYRDELIDNLNDTHDEFVKSRRRQLIGEINELLNWEL